MGQGESSGNENAGVGSNPELRGLEDRLTEKVKNLTGSGVSQLRNFEERLDELTSDLQVERRERVTSETRLEALYAEVREATDNDHVVRNMALLSADVVELKHRLKSVSAMAEQTRKEIAGGRPPPGSGPLKIPGSEEALPDDLRRLRSAVDACVRQIAHEKALFEDQRMELHASLTELQERFGGDISACRESIAASTMERQAQELSIKSLVTQEQAARDVGHSSLRELLEQQAKSLGDKLAKMGADWEVERGEVQRQIAKVASASSTSRSGPQAPPSSQMADLEDLVSQQAQQLEAVRVAGGSSHETLHELMRGQEAVRADSHEHLLKGILENKEQIKNQQQSCEAILLVLQSAGLGEAQDEVFAKEPAPQQPAPPEEPAPQQPAPFKDWKAAPEQDVSRPVDPPVPRPVVPDRPQSPTPPKAVMAAGMLPLRFLSSGGVVAPKASAGGGGSKPRTVSPTVPSFKRQPALGEPATYLSPRIQGSSVGMPVAAATASLPPGERAAEWRASAPSSGAAGGSSFPPTAGCASGPPPPTSGEGSGSHGPFLSNRFAASDARGGQGSPARERRPWQSTPASDYPGPEPRPPVS